MAPVRRPAGTFETVTAPHYEPLGRRLVLVLGNEHDARDVAQDAYPRAYRAWGRFDGADARAWLHTIALRLAFNQLRRRRRWFGLLSTAGPPAWNDRSDPDFWNALRRLEPRPRAALLLTVLDGRTLREAGEILGAPEGTVASWVSRGRAALRAELGPDGSG